MRRILVDHAHAARRLPGTEGGLTRLELEPDLIPAAEPREDLLAAG